MIAYNVTVKVELDIHEEWITWMRNKHIQDVINTGCFHSARINKLLGQDETDGITYSIQYFCPDMKTLHQYQVNHAQILQQEHVDKFSDKAVAFRSIMEMIEEFTP